MTTQTQPKFKNPQLQEKIKKLIQAKDWQALKEVCLSDEFNSLPYEEKNYQFITASKVKAFRRCELEYKYRYIDLVDPVVETEEKDYFTIGTAFDDLITYGEDVFNKKYVCMDTRVKDVEAEISIQEMKIEEARKDLKKDGTRSKRGLDAEFRAAQRIRDLEVIKNKTQLTNSQWDVVMQMKGEFYEQKMFNHEPKKEVFFFEFGPLVLKVELDDFNGKEIRDLKTTANILRFNPENYEHQAGMYPWIVEENTGEKLPFMLEVVDKHSNFSRSQMWRFKDSTIWDAKREVVKTLDKMKRAMDADFYWPTNDPNVYMNSDYYGYEGYGRPTEPLYY